ncbi:MAG: glycogen synthase GlgA [Eubacteriaceae bacterium]|jgi:starch synthase|nr:glycogen synthase GlgA [Eubacteriaceae bacterium]
MQKLKVLFAASEAFPFAKSGGLADVIGALPKAFSPDEVDVRVVIPKYGSIPKEFVDKMWLVDVFYVRIGYTDVYAGIMTYKKDHVTYYFVDNEYYFKRPGLYGYYDDGERFVYFSRVVLEMLPFIDFYPDVLHCHDWQTALVPFLLKEQYQHHYLNTKTVFTIHNMKFQGRYGFHDLQGVLNIDYLPPSLEYYGEINLMKGALCSADLVTTVSPSYAEELKDPYYGEGLDGVMRDITYKTVGILNGIDTSVYSPKTDPHIYKNYINSIEKKRMNKTRLQEDLGLPVDPQVPMLVMISRLDEQKGIDLITAVIHEILQLDLQFVVLGTGNSHYEYLLSDVAATYPNKMRSLIQFDEPLSHKLYAAADLFLMPSKFEPCGLSQMIALRYGAIPIVRETGGLRDTVQYFNASEKTGNGFTFATYNAHDLLFTIQKAVGMYHHDPDNWAALELNATKSDFHWRKSASEYLYFYKKITGNIKI